MKNLRTNCCHVRLSRLAPWQNREASWWQRRNFIMMGTWRTTVWRVIMPRSWFRSGLYRQWGASELLLTGDLYPIFITWSSDLVYVCASQEQRCLSLWDTLIGDWFAHIRFLTSSKMDRVERGAAPGFVADHQTLGNERKHTLPLRSGLSAQLQNRVKGLYREEHWGILRTLGMAS